MLITILQGRGKAIVVSTGKQTEVGKISNKLNQKQDKTTPLKRKLKKLSKILVAIAVVLCIIVVGLAFFWYALKQHSHTFLLNQKAKQTHFAQAQVDETLQDSCRVIVLLVDSLTLFLALFHLLLSLTLFSPLSLTLRVHLLG